MANVKISALTAVTAPATTDVVPIVNAGATKKVTIANLFQNASGAWTTWIPTWPGLTIGNAVVTGRFQQIGKLTVCRLHVVFGTTSAFTGSSFTFSLPVTSISYGGAATAQPLGMAIYYDAGSNLYHGVVSWVSTTAAGFYATNTSATYGTFSSVINTVPFTWGNLDELHCEFFYEAN